MSREIDIYKLGQILGLALSIDIEQMRAFLAAPGCELHEGYMLYMGLTLDFAEKLRAAVADPKPHHPDPEGGA